MRLGYTEFSFGYAFTENLLRSIAFVANGAPVFPNLQQEATSGFDIKINLPGVPLFLQYKLPELMTRKTAFEISQHNLFDLTIPFFRMPLMRRDLSQQHDLLIALEHRYPGTVLYAAPCLHNVHEFNVAYNAASVHQQTVFFSPIEIGQLPDDQTHSVSYRVGLAHAYFCSESKRITARKFEDITHEMQLLFDSERFRAIEFASNELRNSIRSLVSISMRATEIAVAERIITKRATGAGRPTALADREERTIINILVAREMARIDLGVDLLIAQPRT
jgi:hypothetical protein